VTGLLYRVGRACSRHHWLTIAVWVIAVIALAIGSRAAGEQTSDNLTLPGTGSTNAQNLLKDRLPQQAYGTNPIVLESSKGRLDKGDNAKAVKQTVKSVKKAPHVTAAVSPNSKAGKAALSKDGKIAYISVTLDEGPSDLTEEEAQTVIDAADPARDAGLDVEAGGYLGQAVSKPETESSEVVGLTAAVIILLFAFGTVTAMLLPIVSAVLGLVATLALIKFLGHVAEVPSIAPTLATMIGLGVGIDYALFIVTRHKLQLKDGMEMRESIARATATAGGAVVFAGTTVVIALVSLLFSGIPFVGTMGYSAAVAVVVAVTAAVTLLPALLGALGPRINSLRVKLGRTHPDYHQPHGWRRWAGGVVARPWRSLVAGLVILIVLALPVLNLDLGSSDNGELGKDTTARQAYDLITEGFGAGQNGPLLVSVQLNPKAKPNQKQLNQINSKQKQQKQQVQSQTEQLTEQLEEQGVPPDQAATQAQQQVQQQSSGSQKKLSQQKKLAESTATDTRLTGLENAVKKDKGIKSVSQAVVDKAGTAAVFTAVPTTAPSAAATGDTVERLRDDVIPKEVAGSKTVANVGGQAAAYIDLADRIASKLPQMILIVVGLSFIVLMVAFRSLLLPLKAAIANLLSVAAAYGVVTFVFQEGHGASLIGLDGPVPIASYVPLLMFAILFGLSMDYEVFLLTQIQERYRETRDAHKAVVEGLASTGRVITSAALIMVCVFSSFVLNGDAIVKQFGIGLAVAIAIDATIVRCLAVPAAMALMGDRAWWMPRWLDRLLPKISVEGDDYFAERDAAQARERSLPAQA
jgi:RND superfamily putative drug exporter